MIEFTTAQLHKLTGIDTPRPWWFEAAMIGACEPLLNDCEDNYEVRDKLKAAGVLEGFEEDTESCALVVQFVSKRDGEEFLRRLNAYLKEKERRLQEAKDF